jgi:hypothetical protein
MSTTTTPIFTGTPRTKGAVPLDEVSRAYLVSTIEVLDTLLAQLLDGTPNESAFWLRYRDVAWLRPLLRVGAALHGISVSQDYRPSFALGAVQELADLVEGKSDNTFSRNYVALRESRPAAVTLHIKLLSRCLGLTQMFRAAAKGQPRRRLSIVR